MSLSSTLESTKLTITGTSFQFSLSSSLTVDDVTLHASPPDSDKLSFERSIRNNVIIQVINLHSVYHIRLLDQRGDPYDATSQSPEGVSAARCVLLSTMIDPLQLLIDHDLLQSLIKCYGLGGYVPLKV